VTLGKNEVLINGESRPLDVPPMMYKGVLLVPVRVISEALGAYVQWVPEQHVCVVRYIPPTPVPTPAPTAPPTAVPTPAPSPTPKPVLGYVQGGYTEGRVSNEFTDGTNITSHGLVVSGAYLFSPLAIKIDWRQDMYYTPNNPTPTPIPTPTPTTSPTDGRFLRHKLGVNTIDGGAASVPAFTARQSTIDGRVEFKILNPWVNFGLSYLQAATNYGYPIVSGPGAGLEKLENLTPGSLGWFASGFYYPNVRGVYTVQTGPNAGLNKTIEYQIYKYDVGLDYVLGSSPLYVYGGFSGDRYQAKQSAPSNETHAGPYLGIGFKF
ncbi:MAG TPA: copper amine oxidase N-terminal domain-containing protein, partial [Candidatus Acidoferrales bacterium]|nr:copper amine oxidase N-terminal domain-containing protein [Candidatus Acidoferrales bacterium]